MAHHDYERLREALCEELALWKPSEQDFQASLAKAKANAGLTAVWLSAVQKNALLEIYHEAQVEEWRAKDAAAPPPAANAVVVDASASQLTSAIDGLPPTLPKGAYAFPSRRTHLRANHDARVEL